MKHIPTFEDFVNESYNRTQNKYKTQNVDWDDIAPGDYIADGPNVGEVSRVISNTKKGFTLKRVWNNVRKKDGEEFFVPHDLEAMKDHPKSVIKVMDYVNESEDLNEGLKFNDSNGNPNAISREILGYVEKAFPAKVLSAIESVEPNGYNEMSSPGTTSNKGQARGVREYQTITLLINEGGIGKSKVSSITVGLVKRTSGPGTGYIAIKANHYQGSSANHILLDNIPNFSVAKEFYDNAPEQLKKLFDEVLAKHV